MNYWVIFVMIACVSRPKEMGTHVFKLNLDNHLDSWRYCRKLFSVE
jgi:hypothetical protein